MAALIAYTDITDHLFESFPTATKQAYVAKSEYAVIQLASEKGVDSTDIETTTVHYLMKEYSKAWACMTLFFEHIGANNVETTEVEKYIVKYNLYKDMVAQLSMQITPGIITGATEESRDIATNYTTILYRQ
jgi:hypothetical protein